MGLSGGIFEWTVSAASGPPAWVNFPSNFTFSGGQVLSQALDQYFSDPSGQVNTFVISGAPSWLTLLVGTLNNPLLTVSALDRVGTFLQISITSTNTDGLTATTPLFSVTINKGVNRAPTWTQPGVINMLAGTSQYDLTTITDDLDNDTQVYAPVNPLILPNGWSLTGPGIIKPSAAVLSGTYNFILSAFDGTTSNNSPTLSFSVLHAVLGTWNENACITIARGGTFDIAQWNSGQINVTYSMLQFASLPFNVPSGLTLNGSILTAAVGTTLTTLAGGPNCYVMFRQSDGSGGTRDTTIPISIVVVATGTPTYSTFAPNGTTQLGGPFATIDASGGAQSVGGTTGTPGVPSTYDVIKVSGGALSLLTNWVPRANRMYRIVAADPTLPIVKDMGNIINNIINNGQAGSAPVSYWWDVSGIWPRNSKALNTALINSDPGTQGGALRMTTLCNNTQNITVRDSVFEDCNEAAFTSKNMQSVRFINTRHINCGVATGNAESHGMYVDGDLIELRGTKHEWTYNYDMLPLTKTLWACAGHDIKARVAHAIISSIYIKMTLQKSDGTVAYANTTEKIDLANGGLLEIQGSIIIEGTDSAYNPAHGDNFKQDNKIIGYNAVTNVFPVNEVYILQNTIINFGQSTESFLRWIANGGGPNPSGGMIYTQGGAVGTVDATARTFTISSASAAVTGDSIALQASGVQVIYKNGTGALGGVVNGNKYWVGIIDNTHAALYNVKSDSQANINRIAITAPGNGLKWSLTAVADVYLIKDNVMLGTTVDGSATLQSDGNTYGQDNTMGSVNQLANSNPLTESYALSIPVPASQNWVDSTGASDTYSPT